LGLTGGLFIRKATHKRLKLHLSCRRVATMLRLEVAEISEDAMTVSSAKPKRTGRTSSSADF
jgi:hypothetical protein